MLNVDRAAAHRIVVVSPHLDDAILSAGATIARLARVGFAVDVLTVFAGDPRSSGPANGWDARGGFASERAAAEGRRAEDFKACSLVGARAVWLPFSDGGYARPRNADEVWAAAEPTLSGAVAVLAPGYPLTNPDHAWVNELLRSSGRLPLARVGWYVEQPYAFWLARGEGRARHPGPLVRPRAWEHAVTGPRDRWAKWRAIRAYRSQSALLGPAWSRAVARPRLLSDRSPSRETVVWPASFRL